MTKEIRYFKHPQVTALTEKADNIIIHDFVKAITEVDPSDSMSAIKICIQSREMDARELMATFCAIVKDDGSQL